MEEQLVKWEEQLVKKKEQLVKWEATCSPENQAARLT